MADLNHYVEAFANLRRGGGGKYAERPATLYKAPHKPLLLLAVLDLAADEALPKNLIELNADLEARFEAYWSLVMTPADQTTIAKPFFHLANDGFWHLLPRPGQKHWAALQRYTPSTTQLKKALTGARFDRKLYALIHDPSSRKVLRRTLIEAHFDPAVHEQLLQHGSQSDAEADGGTALPAGLDIPKGTPRQLAAVYIAVRRILKAVGLVEENTDQLPTPTAAAGEVVLDEETFTLCVKKLSETETHAQADAGHPPLQEYLAWASSEEANPSAAPVTEPWSETEEQLPTPAEVPLAELIDRWIRRYLPERERALIEGHYPLYQPAAGAAEPPPNYEAPAGWQELLQDNALRVLREQREDVAAIFELFDQLLAESDGVLTADVMPKLLAYGNVQVGELHPQGFLAFLADLNDAWTFHGNGAGVLVLAGLPAETRRSEPDDPAPEQGTETEGGSLEEPEKPASAPPVRETSVPLELFRRWLQRLLTRREREIIARRYGLFGEPEEPAALAGRYDEPEETLRKVERAALRTLFDHLQDLAPVYNILEQALAEHGGVLRAPGLLELPEFAPASQVGLLPAGLLSLLAALREDWRFYAINGGTLVAFRERDKASTTTGEDVARSETDLASLEEKMEAEAGSVMADAARGVEMPAFKEPEPDYSTADDVDKTPEPPAAPAVRIDFATSTAEVLENARQWNRDLETDEGKAQWGRRLVTYFVYDPGSETFAPSKFCAYVAIKPEPGLLTVAQYAQIDPSLPIFDGHRAREYLAGKLEMKLLAVEGDSALARRFQQWAQRHEASIKVHANGPQLLLPPEAVINDTLGMIATSPATEMQAESARETTAASTPPPRRRKVRETGPLWVAPVSRAVEPDIDPRSPLFPIETELRERLHRVDFIGELAVERSQFEEWCRLVQREAIRTGIVRPKLVPPALFVTLMVLAARYSEEEARRFWRPYARMVWGLAEASQAFQAKCRDYFRRAIDFLSQEYGLVFPQRSLGDLVRPVYRHAIIPAYLERDFVDWLKSRWKDVLEVPPDHLVAHLQQEHSLRYLPPTLYRFISEPDTAVSAADLIRDMAFAASLYAEGQSLDFIAQLLADNPIERSLWEEFVAGLAAQEEKERRRPQTRLEWVWSLETAEIMLRLRNAVLYTTSTPDLAVWVEAGTRRQDLARADLYSRLDPWKLEQGTWLVDELLFAADGPLAGKVVLLGDDDSILWEQDIPPLPRGPVQFFRLTQQRAYALPVDNNSLQPGDYVLACDKAVTLNGVEATVALAEETLTLPYHLKQRFSLAGIYQVSLPLTVKHERQTILEVATSGTGLAADPPSIRGHAPIPGLSSRVPPAFADRDIWLLLPGASNRLLDRTTLWLRSQRGTFQRHLLRELDVEVDDAGTFWVPLRSLLDEAGGFYSLELRQGLRALLPAPLELVHIPDLECVPPPVVPPEQPVYTPVVPPSAQVRGIQLEQIGNLAQVEAAPGEDDWLVITWHQLHSDCRLLLRVNEQSIPLAWPVKRFFAWTEPEADDGVFTPEELEEVAIQAAGSPDVVDYFFLSIPGREGRQRIDLTARGQFSASIRHHNLYDMIRHDLGPRTQVDVSVFSETWPLFIVRRPVADPGTGESDDRPGSSKHPQTTTVGIPGAPPVAVNAEEARAALTNLLADMGSSEPTAKELWLLASEPIEALSAHDTQRLQEAWEPLGRLLIVHDVESWEERYGLLPYWAVTGRPLHFTLNRGTTVVYPEAALQRGRRGIGYANLGFIHGVTRVYVAWVPSDAEEAVVRVRFGMPPRTRTDSYLDVDELDLEAVFQCKVCGRFLSYGQWRRHTHADQKFPDTVDLLNTLDNDPVLVRIAPASHETRLQFQRDPSDVVDSAMVSSGLGSRQGRGARRGPPPNPTTAAGYRDACSAWLERYWEMPGARAHIPHLFSHPKWQAAAKRLEDYLDSDFVTLPPPFIAMARLLGACHPRDHTSVYGLDRNVLLLALLARHAGHDPVGAASLRRRIGIDENLLGQLLYDADIYIPELLQWALTWSELFFVHTLT